MHNAIIIKGSPNCLAARHLCEHSENLGGCFNNSQPIQKLIVPRFTLHIMILFVPSTQPSVFKARQKGYVWNCNSKIVSRENQVINYYKRANSKFNYNYMLSHSF